MELCIRSEIMTGALTQSRGFWAFIFLFGNGNTVQLSRSGALRPLSPLRTVRDSAYAESNNAFLFQVFKSSGWRVSGGS
jgi:hypothetical protein